ncbi:MAG TPA: hypothetical protein VJL54_00110 [Nitrososphaera sp.]|jgi:hypothetical protein|nr:hypothetical protein [Nitrososphaera sp.]
MTLDTLRQKALYQNTIDVWISYCEELGKDWYDIPAYRRFIGHLSANGVKMQKFPLCIKESGGMYERGRDKTQFLDELSKLSDEDASAFTIKLGGDVLAVIRKFSN